MSSLPVLGRSFVAVRHYFIDSRLVISRSVSYAFSITILAVVFFCTEFLLEKYLFNNDEAVDIISALIGSFVFYWLRNFFDRITDSFFFRKEYDYGKALDEIPPLLNRTIDLKILLRGMYEFLSRTIRISNVIFIFEEASNPLFFNDSNRSNVKNFLMGDCEALLQALSLDAKTPIFINSYDKKDPVAIAANALGVIAIIPLALKEEPHAFILLGNRRCGRGLRKKDIALLNALAHQAGMAIRNARLYEEIRRYNDILEVRVAERTEKITAMYESRSQFLTEISHELQTPIAILRGEC